MPRRDGTGPMGLGEMTGRGLGPCTGSKMLKYGASAAGLGLGIGFVCKHVLGRRRKKGRNNYFKNPKNFL